MTAAEKLRATVALPRGVELNDLGDLIEKAQVAAFDADEAMDAAQTFIRAGLAGATTGGITLTVGDLKAVETMLSLVKGRTAAARSACAEVALARLEGVQ